MMARIIFLLCLALFAVPSYAAGTIIAATVFGLAAGTFAYAATAFAINMVISAVVSRALFQPQQPAGDTGLASSDSPNPGNRQQIQPATDNKLPVVYGDTFIGGTVTDLSITSDNQKMFYVISLAEVTGNGSDVYTFNNVYYGGKRVIFGSNGWIFNNVGTIVEVGTDWVRYANPTQEYLVGYTQTFANNTSAHIYTVKSNDLENQIVYYTENISGATEGGVIYGTYYNGTGSYTVQSLYDESTGQYNDSVKGKIEIFLYRNGSHNPTNSNMSAIQVMQASGLTYKWDDSKLMSNCAFAIIALTYSQEANITSLESTLFHILNPRRNPGDCLYDYLTNTRYGAAIPASEIDTASLTALNEYSTQTIPFYTYNGSLNYIQRFRFDGMVDTNRTIMQVLQDMCTCSDSLLIYNEIQNKWGVVVQKSDYSVAMAISDSNMVSAISINPLDIANTFNLCEVKFPDYRSRDSFTTFTVDLASVNPSLLSPNEPINKQGVTLTFTNDNVRAQYLATRFLKSAREDLQVQVSIDFTGIQLQAGDVVSMTSTNYGWTGKLFRVSKVTETFSDDGQVTASLILSEFNPDVYNTENITQFSPSPNSGIGDPTLFGNISAPTIGSQFPFAADPYFLVTATTPSGGITQYAEFWYAAYPSPLPSQLLFAGTTAIQSSGTPYNNNTALPPVALTNIPAGNWYIFTRMVNSVSTSQFSGASTMVSWRPQTYQFTERYLAVAYGDSSSGAGFTFDPRNKTYYGLANVPSANAPTNAFNYTWYQAVPEQFGTDNYLIYANRTSRKFSFAVDNAAYLGIGGAFVPSESSVYDQTQWSGLPDGTNVIDLDMRTGQLTKVGTTSVSAADGLLSVTNNTNGTMVVSLQKFLNFGNGVYSKSINPANLIIDVYGRIVGYQQEDNFYYTETIISATAGQTVFNVNHTVGQAMVWLDGVLLQEADYLETSTTFTLVNPASAGELLCVHAMRAVSDSDYYDPLLITIASATSNSIVYNNQPYQKIKAGDVLAFTNTGTPTNYTVQSINYGTKTIVFTTSITGATTGESVFRFRAAGSEYPPFSRWNVSWSAITSYTPDTFQIRNGYEQIFVNGSGFNEIDYDLTESTLSGFPSAVTGSADIIVFAANNLGVPCSNITNSVIYSVYNDTSYSFPNNPLSVNVYANGALLMQGATYDYEANAAGYNLTTPFMNNFTLLNQQTLARIGAA